MGSENRFLSESEMRNQIGFTFFILRKALDMTQTEIGQELGVTRNTVINIEKADSDNDISLEMSYRLYFFAQEMLDNEALHGYISNRANKLKVLVRNNIISKVSKQIYKDTEKKLKEELPIRKHNNKNA